MTTDKNFIHADPMQMASEFANIPYVVLSLRSKMTMLLTNEIKKHKLSDEEAALKLGCDIEIIHYIKNGNITKLDNSDLLVYLSKFDYQVLFEDSTLKITDIPKTMNDDFNDKLLSSFGDGWYDGFLAAKELVIKGENIESYSKDMVLEMSERAELESQTNLRKV